MSRVLLLGDSVVDVTSVDIVGVGVLLRWWLFWADVLKSGKRMWLYIFQVCNTFSIIQDIRLEEPSLLSITTFPPRAARATTRNEWCYHFPHRPRSNPRSIILVVQRQDTFASPIPPRKRQPETAFVFARRVLTAPPPRAMRWVDKKKKTDSPMQKP